MSRFIETLCSLHCEFRIHCMQSTRLLLKCARNEWPRCSLRPWPSFRLLYGPLHDIVDILQIILSGLLIFKVLCHGCRQIRPDSLHSPGGTHLKVCNLSLTVNNKSQSGCLTPTCTECVCNMFPEKWTNRVSNHHIEHSSRLLRIYTIHVEYTRLCDSRLYSLLRNFMKHCACGCCKRQL